MHVTFSLRGIRMYEEDDASRNLLRLGVVLLWAGVACLILTLPGEIADALAKPAWAGVPEVCALVVGVPAMLAIVFFVTRHLRSLM